jgi:ubiquinone/menaquinone biosynthesis C-methylase UbiE
MQPKDKVNILDAGSGFTFFPYYISYKHANCNVYCCDYDYSLINLFDGANKKSKQHLDFKVYDLTNLGYKDNSFDAVYCISVLEHALNREKIFEQFKRVLKPNSLLILSFDISLEDRDKSAKGTQFIRPAEHQTRSYRC